MGVDTEDEGDSANERNNEGDANGGDSNIDDDLIDIYAIPPGLDGVTDDEEDIDDDDDEDVQEVESENEDPDNYNSEDEFGDFYDESTRIAEEAGNPSDFSEISFTMLSLFIWVTTSNISQASYATFAKMVKDPEFNVDEIPSSINTVKKLRRKFPLDNIYSHVVPVEKVDGDSKTKTTANCFYFDLKDVIRNWLENPQVINFCHFGLGESVERCREPSHGLLWRESILTSISEYPISTTDRNGNITFHPKIHPGSTLLFTSRKGNFPIRITGLFKKQIGETDEFEVYGSVNVILIRKSDMETFSVTFTDEEKSSLLEFTDDVDSTATSPNGQIKGYIILFDFAVPTRTLCQLGEVDVFIKRDHHPRDPDAPPPNAENSADFNVSWCLPVEKGSTPKRGRLMELFGAPRNQPMRQATLQRSQSTYRDAPPTKKFRGNQDQKIIVSDIVHTRHLRTLLAEDELRKEEISMDRLQQYREEGTKYIGVAIDLYTDKFGPYRTTHRSVGGIYLNLHNLNAAGRDQPRNHSLCGFIPNGGSFDTAAEPIIKALRELATGFTLELGHRGFGKVVVFVKLLSLTSDMAEANGLAGVKGVGCIAPCRFCDVKRERFGIDCFRANEAELLTTMRQVHTSRRIRREAFDINSKKRREAILKPYGLLRLPTALESFGPSFNPFIQVALDTSHSEAKGLGEAAIGILVDKMLSANIGKKVNNAMCMEITDIFAYRSSLAASVRTAFPLTSLECPTPLHTSEA